jgi:hypothetical protein
MKSRAGSVRRYKDACREYEVGMTWVYDVSQGANLIIGLIASCFTGREL